MNNIKAVLFDLDGTLIHTFPRYRYTIVGQTLKDLGIATSQQLIDKFWFELRRNEIIKVDFGVDPEVFWGIYEKYDTTEFRRECTEPYPDINFVKELRQKGYKTAIVTGAPSHIANLEIGMLGRENFDVIIIARSLNGINPKPHPHGLTRCLSILKVHNDQAIYVGNAEEDIITAKNAHIFSVLLKRGEYEFQGVTPSLTINSLHDLRKHLKL